MGRKTVWDGKGLPSVGDEVLFNVASTPEIQSGVVESIDVERYDKNDMHSWRIMVHMSCVSTFKPNDKYTMSRFLADIRPVFWREGDE